jgi:REP element-mobilizing transposase RayT
MAHAFGEILVHVVFSTKQRQRWLDDQINLELYPYIVKILNNHNCRVLQIGGIDNHIHILCDILKTLPIAKLIEEIKSSSSKWIKTKGQKYQEFSWQQGYGAFTVSPCQKNLLCNYISKQKQHHKAIGFENEFRELLQENQVNFDERRYLG